ncbi:transposable element Tcb1 transposase [Trichonephila clavipes]|nr:transposable element Tcb1 transposase [Trichonephila clavipes]
MGRSVSAETVRNVIRHAGYSSRVARKKPFISLQNQKKRLEFSKANQLKTNDFWKLYLVTKPSSHKSSREVGRREERWEASDHSRVPSLKIRVRGSTC